MTKHSYFPIPRRVMFAVVACICLLGPGILIAEDRAQPEPEWISPDGISGSLVICGGGELPESVYKLFVHMAGGEKAKLVIVPTASEHPEKLTEESLTKRWTELGVASARVMHASSREQADGPGFLTPLKEATGVWFGGGQQSRLALAYLGTAFETELQNLLKRGGVVGGTSAGAAIQSRVMIAGGKREPDMQTGLDLLPGTIIDQHFTQRNRQPRLRQAVKQHPDCVGLGIDEGTALVVGLAVPRVSPAERGRQMRVIGRGEVTVILAASETKPAREYRVGQGGVLDLTQLRRAARERLKDFPQGEPAVSHVPKGSLVIIGGGGMPRDVVDRILELAGGPDCKFVSLATGNSPNPEKKEGPPIYFTRAGAKNITVLSARGPEELSSAEAVKALKEADCVWFGGGRQWRFVDAYEGTPALELFHDVLKRGGVICGSSAGASIQGEYLARADAVSNRIMMAEGYQRGFNFLPGTAIDQHFAQRNRFGDLRSLVSTHPQYLGIGIDEATAIIVRGEVAEVMGKNQVHFFDANLRTPEGKVAQISLAAGASYQLAKRRVLNPAVAEKAVR